MAGETIKIIDMRQLPSPDPQRIGKVDCIVIYEHGAGLRSSVRLPAEDLSDERIKAAVQADLKERSKWLGKILQL
jgi:hypothetical protein